MNTFSFDNVYFFDRQEHDDYWYAYTHPSRRDFTHGYFDATSCLFVKHISDGRNFSQTQIVDIETILKNNRRQMDLSQFEAHSLLPAHYCEIRHGSNRFLDFIQQCKWMGRCDATFSLAFKKLRSIDPAFRLTRDFVASTMKEMESVTLEEKNAWLREMAMDTWTYDHNPDPTETFEDFFAAEERKLQFVDPIPKKISASHRLYEIRQLPGIYLLEEYNEYAGHKWRDGDHYIEVGRVFARTGLGTVYIL